MNEKHTMRNNSNALQSIPREVMLEKRRQQQAEVIKRMQYQERHKRLQACLDRWAKGKV